MQITELLGCYSEEMIKVQFSRLMRPIVDQMKHTIRPNSISTQFDEDYKLILYSMHDT